MALTVGAPQMRRGSGLSQAVALAFSAKRLSQSMPATLDCENEK
jgi:hypothetical protein